MKKVSVLLMLVFALVNFSVFAEATPTIVVTGGEAAAGETVDVTIALSDNPGIISMLLDVSYDETAMTLTNVKDAGVFGEAIHSDNLAKKPYTLFWSNGAAKSDFKVNGTIATLTFTVSANAKAGDYPVEVSYSKELDGIFNFDFENIDFAIENGKITVKGSANAGQSSGGTASGGGYISNTGGNSTKDDKGSASDTNDGTSKTDDAKETNSGNPNKVFVLINGSNLVFPDQEPVIVEDRTLVPLRAIFEALGATVDWDDATRTVTSVKGDITISLAIESDQLYVNGTAKTIDVPAQIINDRTMVPIRAIAESFGCDVGWDGETRTVTIAN